MRRYDAWLDDLAGVLAPLLDEIPPKLGSRKPQDLVEQLKLLKHLRGLDTRRTVEVTRLFTMSIADLLEDCFTSDAIKGVLSVSGVIGTWAGPAVGRDGVRHGAPPHRRHRRRPGRRVGLPARRHGWREQGPCGGRQVVRRGDPHLDSGRADPTCNGVATGVVLDGGEELSAPIVVTTAHPEITFLA